MPSRCRSWPSTRLPLNKNVSQGRARLLRGGLASATESRAELEHFDSELFAAAPHVFLRHGQPRVALAIGTVHIPIIALVLRLDDARERGEISVYHQNSIAPA